MLSHGSSGNRLITMLQAELPGPHALLLHEQTRAPARNWVTAGPVIYMPGITGQRTPPDVGTHANSVSSLVPCFLEQHAYAHPFVSPVLLGHRNCMCPGISRRIRARENCAYLLERRMSGNSSCPAGQSAEPTIKMTGWRSIPNGTKLRQILQPKYGSEGLISTITTCTKK